MDWQHDAYRFKITVLNTSALTLANIMWLLAAMTFVIAPHTQRLPWWATAACVAAGVWRWWIARNGFRTPPWWAMSAIAIAITAAAFLEYKRLFGREVGIALLIVMLCLKVLEMKMKRDAMVVIFLGFFLALTNFMYSQTLAMGAYMLVCVWIFVATLIGFNRIHTEPTLRERLMPSAWLLLQGIPLMLVLFFLFPRMSAPLWGMPQENSARSGLSDSMSPGDISKLSQSDAVAFRVEFEGAIPNTTDLYWRGPVLGMQTGKGWRMYDVSPVNALNYIPEGPLTNYRVTLQPHNKPWLFALDMPSNIPPDAYVLGDYQLRSRLPVTTLKAYDMSSHLRFRAGVDLKPRDIEPYLRYDTNINPRAIAYAKKLRDAFPDKKALIEQLMGLYNREFTYTLEPPLLGNNPVDEFLFDTKQGFCEHYSSSFVFVLRAAGIPARVVTGYQGGEINPITRQLIVRQADAHAWSEVWFDDLGWVRADPTFAVSPLRINRGLSAAVGPQGVFDNLAAVEGFGILKQAVFTWDAINSTWNQWVVGFNQDRQRGVFDKLGIKDADWRTLSIALMIGIFVAGGGVGLFIIARAYRSQRPPVIAAYERFCAKLAKTGLVRAPNEGPQDFLRRIEIERSASYAEARQVIDAYVAARYANVVDDGERREKNSVFIQLARRFRA